MKQPGLALRRASPKWVPMSLVGLLTAQRGFLTLEPNLVVHRQLPQALVKARQANDLACSLNILS